MVDERVFAEIDEAGDVGFYSKETGKFISCNEEDLSWMFGLLIEHIETLLNTITEYTSGEDCECSNVALLGTPIIDHFNHRFSEIVEYIEKNVGSIRLLCAGKNPCVEMGKVLGLRFKPAVRGPIREVEADPEAIIYTHLPRRMKEEKLGKEE